MDGLYFPIFGKPRMNKVVGAGAGSGSGPTAAAAAAAAQKQKSLLQRVETDVSSLVDNFTVLVNVARINDPPVRNTQEALMMEVRASRMGKTRLLTSILALTTMSSIWLVYVFCILHGLAGFCAFAVLNENGGLVERWEWPRPDLQIYTTLVLGLAASLRVSDALKMISDICRVGASPGEEVYFFEKPEEQK